MRGYRKSITITLETALNTLTQKKEKKNDYANPVKDILTCTNCKQCGHTIQKCFILGGGVTDKRLVHFKVLTKFLEKQIKHF